MTGRLEGKTALVTGAGTGIGLAVALRFANEGARVIVADRDAEAADAAVTTINAHRAVAVVMDISDEAAVEAAFAQLESAGMSPDVVVANAGVQLFGHDAKAADLDLDVWRRTIDINLTGTFLTVKHAVRSMLARGVGGSIILTGSPTGPERRGQGLHRLQRLEGRHPRARAYGRRRLCRPGHPREHGGARRTPRRRSSPRSRPTRRHARRSSAASRSAAPGSPADVEGIMVYLASDDGAFATGALFAVDGGHDDALTCRAPWDSSARSVAVPGGAERGRSSCATTSSPTSASAAVVVLRSVRAVVRDRRLGDRRARGGPGRGGATRR